MSMIDHGLTADAATHPCLCVNEHRPMIHRTHIHHIHPLSFGGPDIDSNKIALCPTIHGEVHLILEDWCRQKKCAAYTGGSHYAFKLALLGWIKAIASGWTP